MITAYISGKGQLTLPVHVRRKLGIKPCSKMELNIKDDEIILRPIRTISEVEGVFRKYAEGKSADWETARGQTEHDVSEKLAEDRR